MTDVTEPEGEAADALPPGMAELFLPLFDKTVLIAVDEQRVASVADHKVAIEGGRDFLLIVTDRYASRAEPGEDGAVGEEVYVRVLEPISGEEKWHMIAHSDRDGITSADPIVTFAEDGASFTVNLTSAPPVVVSLDEVD